MPIQVPTSEELEQVINTLRTDFNAGLQALRKLIDADNASTSEIIARILQRLDVLEGKVPPAVPTNAVTIVASADHYAGYPEFSVIVEPHGESDKFMVTAKHADEMWEEITVDLPGDDYDKITLRYENDLYLDSNNDRNLYIKELRYKGETYPASASTFIRIPNKQKLQGREKLSWNTDMIFTIKSQTEEPQDPPVEEPEDPPVEDPQIPGAITTQPLTNYSEQVKTNVPVSFGLNFAMGQVPSNHCLVFELEDGTPIPSAQVDDRFYYPDGSLGGGDASMILPTMPAGRFNVVIKSEPGGFDNNGDDLSTVVEKLSDPKYDLHLSLTDMVAEKNYVDVSGGPWEASLLDSIDYSVKLVGRGKACHRLELKSPLTNSQGQDHDTVTHTWYVNVWNLPTMPVEYIPSIEQHKMWTKCDKLTYKAQLYQGTELVYDYGEVMQTHHGGWFGVDIVDGKSRWLNIEKPTVEVNINTEHLVETGLIPHLDTSIVMDPPPASAGVYKPGGRHDLRYAFDGTGGSAQIAPIPQWSSRWILSGGDPTYGRISRFNSLSFHHLPCSFIDDRTGHLPNLLNRTNGPEGDWSILGEGQPETRWPSGYNGPQGSNLPDHNRNCEPEWKDQFDNTHFPNLPYWHHRIEGGRHWLNMVHQSANWALMQWRYREHKVGDQTFHGVVTLQGQMRGVAWGWGWLVTADATSPTYTVDPDDPVIAIGQYIDAAVNNNLDHAMARIKTFEDAGIGHMGIWNDTDTQNYTLSSWQQDFFIITTCLGYTAGKKPKMKALAEYLGRWRTGLLINPDKQCPYWSTAYKHAIRPYWKADGWINAFEKVMVVGEYVNFKEDNRLHYKGGDWEWTYLTEGTEIQFSFRTALPPEFNYAQNLFIRNPDPTAKTFQVSETPDGPIKTFAPSSIMPKLSYKPDPKICPTKIQADYEYGYGAHARAACASLARCGIPEGLQGFEVIESVRDKSRYKWGSNSGAHGPSFAIVP